jgi:arylsulfatase A-like enzyme
VPGLVCWPGKISGGQVSHDVVHLIDLLPTFVAAAGGSVDCSGHVDGVDLMPLWTGRGHAPPRTLFWEWQSEGADQLAAMRGNDKLVIKRGGKCELYDIAADPSERRDISAAHPDRVERLRSELKEWLASADRGRR